MPSDTSQTCKLTCTQTLTLYPIPKPNNDHNINTEYRPTSFLSPIPKTLQKTLLLYITESISIISHQHGFKHKHSTQAALHNICHQITKTFNNSRPSQRTVAVALNISKVFDTLNIHKLTITNIPNIIIKFVANYIKGDKHALNTMAHSKLKRINTGVTPVEFCLQHYSTFTPLIFHYPQKTYKSQHMLMT